MIIKKILKLIIPQKFKKKLKEELGCTSSTANYKLSIVNQKRLNGLKVLVTGGSGAIGSAICFRLAMEGAIVGVCARSIDKANVVVNNICNNGGVAIPVIMDVTKDESVKEGIKKFCELYGEIDILINNAGGSARKKSTSFEEQDFQVIEDVVNLNLRGTLLCTNEVLKYMRKASTSRIINMSSVVGMRGKSGMTDYAAAKAGIIGFTKSLAIELGTTGITVNCISPGSVCQVVFDKNIECKKENVNCKGQGGNTDDIAGVVAFLISDDGKYITGQNIVVDGGRTLGLWGDN